MPEKLITLITDHVYWMAPDKPDRPSLCVVVGTNRALMLDAAASAAHARHFLDTLSEGQIPTPDYVALTHWHWDHIFGASELNIPIIAHAQTAAEIAVQATYQWDDAALDARVAAGKEIAFCVDNIKLELPEPREVYVIEPDIIFQDGLDINLGNVQVHIQHVGGDHATDSCVMHIMPDKVLFLGDCLYDAIYTPVRYYTTRQLFPLVDTILRFEADYYIEGHTPNVMSRAELLTLVDQMRLVGATVDRLAGDQVEIIQAVSEQLGVTPDEETKGLIDAFVAGYKLDHPHSFE